jgi:hypothetical protein
VAAGSDMQGCLHRIAAWCPVGLVSVMPGREQVQKARVQDAQGVESLRRGPEQKMGARILSRTLCGSSRQPEVLWDPHSSLLYL